MKRIAYVAMGEASLNKAHSIQTFHTCKNLAKENKVKVIYPLSPINYMNSKETKGFYRDSNLELKFIPKSFLTYFLTRLNLPGRYFFYFLERLLFSFLTFVHILGSKTDIVFIRDPVVAFFFAVFRNIHKKKLVYEIHKFEYIEFERASLIFRKMSKHIETTILKNFDAVIATSSWLGNYVKRFNKNTLFLPNAFDGRAFKPKDKYSSRKKLNIPKEYKILMYSGISFRQGIENLIYSMKNFDKNDKVMLYVVGGLPEQVVKLAKVSKKLKLDNRIVFVGSVPHQSVSDYLNASDLLILPYSRNNFTEYLTSPLKLFEYMAVKKPIIATKVGCFKGILKNGENALLVEPDNPKALLEGVKRILKDEELAKRIAKNAYEDSKKYTYDERMSKIGKILYKI